MGAFASHRTSHSHANAVSSPFANDKALSALKRPSLAAMLSLKDTFFIVLYLACASSNSASKREILMHCSLQSCRLLSDSDDLHTLFYSLDTDLDPLQTQTSFFI